ncbi:RimJ/RimL family protein N-acetyltransferase [Streptomyces sp. V4I2]|nr:GNAT family N-acetyltransferase [Streptomyces sp. V4I2]MDQ1046372.1 RimJ/RimL family protein N-acetyltransferase [Streptomyces sp. V4I2]
MPTGSADDDRITCGMNAKAYDVTSIGRTGSPGLDRSRRHGSDPGARDVVDLHGAIGYLFLPETWGYGYAAEACTAALDWFADELPGEPVVLFTQTANARSIRLAAKLGFAGAERFEAYGAEQWLGMWSPVTPSD